MFAGGQHSKVWGFFKGIDKGRKLYLFLMNNEVNDLFTLRI